MVKMTENNSPANVHVSLMHKFMRRMRPLLASQDIPTQAQAVTTKP
jgi:hypothetical protein